MVTLTTPDVNVIIIDFPTPGREMVVPNEDGSYTIFLNAHLSNEEQLKAYGHAMEHIKNNDFSKEDVQEIEAAAHAVATKTAKPIPSKEFEKELARIRRHRQRIQKQLQEYERDIAFLVANSPNPDLILDNEENRWLYG